VKYEFVNLPTDLQGELALDLDGNIAIKKGNKIPVGQYTVQVMATNTKGSETATFTLTITANPNYFTYFRYGNNLGLTPIENYADQFRIEAGGKLNSVKPVPTATDAKDGLSSLKWEVELKHNPNNTKATINESTGQITITGLKQGQCGMVMVTATAGEGKTAVSVKQPVFFHFSMISDSNVQLEYTPFVFQVNDDSLPELVESYQPQERQPGRPPKEPFDPYKEIPEDTHRSALNAAFEGGNINGYDNLIEQLKEGYGRQGIKLGHNKAVKLATFLSNKRMVVKEGKEYKFNRDFYY
jgi:hypothetical protein